MADLPKMAPKLNWDDLTQTAALPLGSWLKTDPWDDKVHMLNAKRYAPMNARDKMPFEVTPIFYKLQRYDASRPRSGSPAAAPATLPAPQPVAVAAPTSSNCAGSTAGPPAGSQLRRRSSAGQPSSGCTRYFESAALRICDRDESRLEDKRCDASPSRSLK